VIYCPQQYHSPLYSLYKYVIRPECFKWAHQRKVFGKALIEQPVIRAKIGAMIAANEALTHWLEHITYQMTKMSYKEAAMKLAGPISLLKYQSTRTSLMISDNAVQIFGGRGITRTGMGSKVRIKCISADAASFLFIQIAEFVD
jgi:hypothetical protein